jgi:hypothetical protein
MVGASSTTHNNCYGIEVGNLQGTLVQSKMVVRSTRTNGLCTIKNADMQKPALQAGLYSEISRESVRPGCWVAEKAPGETAWVVGKVHNVVSSNSGKAVLRLGVYYPGEPNGDAVATVALHSTAGSSTPAKKPSGCFGVQSTRPLSKQHKQHGGAGVAASMVFFKPDSLRYLDTEGAECLMSSVRVQGRALQDRHEQLDTRERLLVEHETQVQQALDGASSERVADAAHLATREHLLGKHELQVKRALEDVSSKRVADAAHLVKRERLLSANELQVKRALDGVSSTQDTGAARLDTRERLLAENELKVHRALEHASGERIDTAAHWHGVKQAFHDHREAVLAADVESRRAHTARREDATQAASTQHAVELQSAADKLLKANTTIESQASAAANGKALLAAEKANAVQANQRLTTANASLQAYVAKAGGSATREQQVSEQRVAKLNSTITELASDNTALASTNAELASENAELATTNEQQVRRVTLLQMAAKDRERLHNEERQQQASQAAAPTERLRRSSPPAGTGARVPVRAEERRGSTHTGVPVPAATHNTKHAGRDSYEPEDDAAYNNNSTHTPTTAAAASTRDWNRSRDENLKPIPARGPRSSREMYPHEPQKQPTASSSYYSVAHNEFVESVMNHMQFDSVPDGL